MNCFCYIGQVIKRIKYPVRLVRANIGPPAFKLNGTNYQWVRSKMLRKAFSAFFSASKDSFSLSFFQIRWRDEQQTVSDRASQTSN